MTELLGSPIPELIGVVFVLLMLILINHRYKSNAKVHKVLLEASLAELHKQTQILQKMLNGASSDNTENQQAKALENTDDPYPKFSAER